MAARKFSSLDAPQQILTRAQAKLLGLTRYFTGKPCKRGHVAERMVSTRHCHVCLYSANRAWCAANLESVRRTARKRYANNPELKRQSQQKYRATKPEKHRQSNKTWSVANSASMQQSRVKWKRANLDKVYAEGARRRAVKIQRTTSWFPVERQAILAVYREARQRSKHTGIQFVVDHYYPLKSKRGSGLHCLANLQIVTGDENCRKGSSWPE